MKTVFALALICLAMPASAQVCVGRYYDADHLAAHPDQRVEEIFFGTLTGEPVLQVRLRTADWYKWHEAACEVTGDVLSCTVPDGRGGFTVAAQGDGTVLLRIGERGARLDRGEDPAPLLLIPGVGDDELFRLYPGKGCLN